MKKLAPYQIFFPLGLFNAVLAVGVWLIQDLHIFQTPALLIHSKLIIGGFLWSFIVGFLMTAIPRMTGTQNANRLELGSAIGISLWLMISAWNIDPRPFYIGMMALDGLLLFYGARRLVKRSSKPVPVFFSHIGFGMALALLGSWYHFKGNSFMGIHLFHVGAILLLILGIGTRFFAFLSGLPSDFENLNQGWKRLSFHFCGLLVAILLFLAGLGYPVAYFALTVVSLFYLFVIWRVQRRAERDSALKYGVRFVALMIPLSFFMTWLQPRMYVTWFHLLFIGSFAVLTLSVATRVTLAHGAYPTDLEVRSKALWWVIGLLVFALIFRVFYGFSDDLWKKSYLHLAATFWLLALAIWCGSFLIRIFKPGPQAKPSCG